MKRIALLGTGAVAALAAGGILVAGTATAAGGTHTVHLKTTRLQVADPSRSTFVETDAVFKAAKKVGYENLSCNDGGTKVLCSLSIALPNGMLLGHVTSPITTSDKTTLTGKVTGGLGIYTGDKGTIKAVVNGKHARYTITYHS
jgi:hypothetical protein